MPKFLETKLEAGASKKGYTGRKADEYVYGALNNMGAMHGNKETAKGAAMQKKHDEKERAGQRDTAAEDRREAAKPKRKTMAKPMHARLAAAMSNY